MSSFFIDYGFYLVFEQHLAICKVYLAINEYLLTAAGHFN